MLRTIVFFGLIAGVIAILPMSFIALNSGHKSFASSLTFGYLVMLLAFSMIFVGVKRLRDQTHGGVIKFLPALLVGLGISVVASVIYAIGWEIALAATHYSFADSYAASMIASAQAKGASAAELQRVTAEAHTFKVQYADPSFRLPMTFIEIFPVGVVVSLIAAALLRNSRFLPARA
jgi:uncharacterized membrane protein YhaH (DUF805 family)